MSLIESIGRTASDAWNGRSDSIGDVVGVGVDSASTAAGAAGGVPGLAAGAALPGGDWAANAVNHDLLGHDPHEQAQQHGNWGNHVGTVIGGIGGLGASAMLGVPTGVAGGMALGSAAGGWIADHV